MSQQDGYQEFGAVGMGDENAYCMEYHGDGVLNLMQQQTPHFYRITIGISRQDLAPFLGKNVVIKSGRFTYSDKQCSGEKCINWGDSVVRLNLDEIEVK